MARCHGTKFLDENKPKTSLKSEFALFQTTSILFKCQMLAKFFWG